jgi:hypothetical protein
MKLDGYVIVPANSFHGGAGVVRPEGRQPPGLTHAIQYMNRRRFSIGMMG